MNTKRFVNFRYIFYPFLIFLFGIVVARELYHGDIETLVLVLLSLLALGGYLIYKRKYKILALLFAFFFLGNGLYFIGEASYKVKEYSGVVSVVGRVSDSFEETQYGYVAILDNVTINGEKAKNIEATFSKGSQVLEIGDMLAFESTVETIPLFTLGSMSASTYRAKLGYTLSISTSDVVITEGWTYFDEDVRQSIKAQIYDNMSEENAAVAYAVLFGDDSGISFEVNGGYRNSGIIHIITVSGLNIAFLITLIYGFLKLCKCNRYLNFTVTVIVILVYTYFCNFAPSVFRAAVMGVIIMLAKISGRRYDVLNSTGLAGFIVLICSPLTAFDAGFLMSVACVCGIVLLQPLFYKWFKKCMPRWVASYISVSLAAQLAILPFLASFQSSLNLLSFVINLFVVPLFAVLYPYLFVISFLCLLMPFLSFSYVLVDWGLTATKFIAFIFSDTALQVKLTPMALAVTFFFFLLLFVAGAYFMQKPLNKFLACSALILCLTFSFGFATFENMLNSGVFYLNSYGQECTLLVGSGGQTMAIGDNYILSRVMNKYNVDKVDYYISFDVLTAEKVKDKEEYGVTYFICLEGEKEKDDIYIAQKGQLMQAGEFRFVYVDFGGRCLGVYVNFDDTSVFVASGEEIGYNDIEACKQVIGLYDPDIVVAGDNFMLADESYLSVASVRNSETTYDFASDGNMLFEKQQLGFDVRRLD